MKKIIVNVSKKGEVKVKTEGYSGDQCMQASAPYERALGRTSSVEPTGEYYSAESESTVEIRE